MMRRHGDASTGSAHRATGDHPTVSTDVGILSEVAEIAVGWIDLTLAGGTDAARRALVERPCPSCAPGLRTATAKHLDTLPVR